MIVNAYFTKDEDGNDVSDTDGITLILSDGKRWVVPSGHRFYQEYLDWKAEDPENNVPQTEP